MVSKPDLFGKRGQAKLLIFGVALCIFAGSVGYMLAHYGIGKNGSKTEYVNSNYGFSFNHPEDWSVHKSSYQENFFYITENEFENIVAGVTISTSDNSITEIRNYIEKTIENNPNISFAEGPETVKDGYGFDFTWQADTAEESYKGRRLILIKDEVKYQLTTKPDLREKNFQKYENEFNRIFDSFELLN